MAAYRTKNRSLLRELKASEDFPGFPGCSKNVIYCPEQPAGERRDHRLIHTEQVALFEAVKAEIGNRHGTRTDKLTSKCSEVGGVSALERKTSRPDVRVREL
jgi:hypothetical protein